MGGNKNLGMRERVVPFSPFPPSFPSPPFLPTPSPLFPSPSPALRGGEIQCEPRLLGISFDYLSPTETIGMFILL